MNEEKENQKEINQRAREGDEQSGKRVEEWDEW